MPLPEEGGSSSGGGSTTNICTVNPSDNVAIINNLISRISDIEKFLSQLVGADVHADNLSELANNIGNILNGTITLPGDGNSPYGEGGSIPIPDGFSGSVISGNVITTWENGVVSFQVDNSGIVVGGGGGGSPSAMFSNYNAGVDTGTGSYANLTIDTELFDDIGLTLSGNVISGFPEGWYLVSAVIATQAISNTGDLTIFTKINGVSWPIADKVRISLTGGSLWLEAQNLNLTGGTFIPSGASVSVKVIGQASTGSVEFRLESITFIQLNTTTAPPP